MIVCGVLFIVKGVIDVINKNTTQGVIAIAIGALVIILGATLLNVALIIFGILLAAYGVIDLLQGAYKNVISLIVCLLTIVC